MARPGLTQHRKFRRLARALGSPIVARGALELLWDGCYEAGEDYVGTTEDIEHAVGWNGVPGVLTQALHEAGAPTGVGFIERVSESGEPTYRVHDLWHHAPDYVAKRRKREMERQGKIDPVVRPPNGSQCPPDLECLDGDVRPPSPSHSPSPRKNVSPEAPAPSGPVFLTFPTAGQPDAWNLHDAQVREWQELYQGIDVRGQCRQALAWVRANPGRKKTSGGMKRYLVGWLSRTTNRQGGSDRRPEMRANAANVPDVEATKRKYLS